MGADDRSGDAELVARHAVDLRVRHDDARFEGGVENLARVLRGDCRAAVTQNPGRERLLQTLVSVDAEAHRVEEVAERLEAAVIEPLAVLAEERLIGAGIRARRRAPGEDRLPLMRRELCEPLLDPLVDLAIELVDARIEPYDRS